MGASLKGQLLIASPTILDPNFRRSVVLMTEHGDEGAMGLILNRAAENGAWRLVRDARFEEVLGACARPREPGDGVWITARLRRLYRRLYEAGLAHSFEIEANGELAAGLVGVLLGRAAMLESMFHRVPDAGNVLLARTLDELAARGFVPAEVEDTDALADGLGRRRVFAGHAGWGPGQLEAEMEEESWIVEPAVREDVFTDDPEDLWSRVLRRKGREYALLSTMPMDPSLN